MGNRNHVLTHMLCSSCQEYISILYHKPRLQVTLRGKRVRTKKVTWDLKKKMEARYKPNFLVRNFTNVMRSKVSHCVFMMLSTLYK